MFSRWQVGSYNSTWICRFGFQALHRLDAEQVCLFFPWLVVWKCKWRHAPLITSFMQCLNEVASESTVLALKCSTWLKTFKVSLYWDLREKTCLKTTKQTKTIIIIIKNRLLFLNKLFQCVRMQCCQWLTFVAVLVLIVHLRCYPALTPVTVWWEIYYTFLQSHVPSISVEFGLIGTLGVWIKSFSSWLPHAASPPAVCVCILLWDTADISDIQTNFPNLLLDLKPFMSQNQLWRAGEGKKMF